MTNHSLRHHTDYPILSFVGYDITAAEVLPLKTSQIFSIPKIGAKIWWFGSAKA
jgi:hypothetical protein